MSAALEPDMWVECVRRSTTGLFTLGAIYCVADVGPMGACGRCDGCAGVRIKGRPNPADVSLVHVDALNWWPSCAFRPVYRPKSETFRSLLQPAPERDLEDA